jgi:hypothetical protein
MSSMDAWRCKRGRDESVVFQQDLIALEWGRHTHRVYFSDRCDKLPFTAGESLIESQLPAVQFAIVACLRGTASLPREEGGGTPSGQNISLQESWKSGGP